MVDPVMSLLCSLLLALSLEPATSSGDGDIDVDVETATATAPAAEGPDQAEPSEGDQGADAPPSEEAEADAQPSEDDPAEAEPSEGDQAGAPQGPSTRSGTSEGTTAAAEAETETSSTAQVDTSTVTPADPSAPVVTEKADAKKKKKKKKKVSWSLGARVMTGWEAELQRPAPDADPPADTELSQGPFLQQARAKLRLDYEKLFAIRISAELSDALKTPRLDRIPYLRNGYARVRFHDAARLHVGHFKRPFSRLELKSPGTLPFRGRGLANGFVLEDRGYGDRSLGGMLWGRIRPARLRYYAGVFAPGLRTEGVDVVGRLRADPWKWLSVGASGGYKRVPDLSGEKVDVASANADLQVDFHGLRVVGDLVMGQDYLAEGRPWSLGLVGYARYDVDLPKKLVLQPVVLVEWADTNIEVSDNDAIRALAGVNLKWRKRFRVMPQAEFVRPRGVIDNPWSNTDTYYLMLSLEL